MASWATGNVTKRWNARQRRGWAAWLAIVALLIDALLPSAVSAAMAQDRAAPSVGLCGVAAGPSGPERAPFTLPPRHCALCCGPTHAVVPALHPGVAAPSLIGSTDLAPPRLAAPHRIRPDYPAAQPRAPPDRI